jgi:hypothetical protein
MGDAGQVSGTLQIKITARIVFREMGEREGAVIPLNSLRGYTDPLASFID